ncbi:MAG: D-glycero-beta-D-manno-heptose 1-phosphate adenylyltransferase [Synergistaceae bacterium]|nr:D-glycero-beta-D-manno-heptose 1-phosphate adenylyltransferase [Synergistaceae bacterium]
MCREWKREGKRVVFTNGCFDVLHAGHVESLERARELGDRLIVGLNSDRSVKALKGESRPLNGEGDRARVLAALQAVDLVVVFDEDTPAELLSELRPHVLAKGGDYEADQLPGRQWVEEVVILPLLPGRSTTEMVRRIKNMEEF